MSITELLNQVGVKNIEVQFLDEVVSNARRTKRGTLVTFGTNAVDPTGILSGESKVGVVCWLPRERFKEICTAHSLTLKSRSNENQKEPGNDEHD